ncbi:MAG: OmpA family protein [Anaerolineae bacterium]
MPENIRQKSEQKQQRHNTAPTPELENLNEQGLSEPSLGPAQAISLLQRQTERGVGPRAVQAARQLSPLMGNRALQRIVGDETAEETETLPAPAQTDDVMPAEMREFLGRGVMPNEAGRDVVGAGGIGGFNAKFDPGQRALIATINIGITFLNGMKINAAGMAEADLDSLGTTNIFEAGTRTNLVNQAATINALEPTAEGRANEVNNFWRWSDGESAPWMDRYKQTVQDAWGARHFFVNNRFPQLFSNVRVNVSVHEGDQPGDHCKAKIIKTRPGGTVSAGVTSGSPTDASDQTLTMSSEGLNPNPDNLLRKQVYFPHNNSRVEDAEGDRPGSGVPATTYLQQFITTYAAADPAGGQTVRLVGHASSSGSDTYNQTLSETRSANVEKFLKDNNLPGNTERTQDTGEGETGAIEDAEWRRVDLIVGSGEAQVTATHEFGHIVGLGDEYATPAGGMIGNPLAPVPVGTAAAHSGMADAMGDDVGGVMRENNDNIMSLGNTVRPQHYATFHNALQIVTGEDWHYGGEGDAPTVLPGTPVPGGGVIV